MLDNESCSREGSVELRRSEIHAITSKIMDEKFKGWKKSAFIFGMAFLLVMAAIVAIGVWYIADLAEIISTMADAANATQQSTITIERNGLLSADYLAAVIPLLLALGGSFIAFLGMNRLKMFDERIDQTRSEMLKEIESKVKSEVAIDRIAFTKQIVQSMEDELQKFDDAVKSADTQLIAQKDKYIEEIDGRFGIFDSKYAWLQTAIEEEQVDLNFHTVDDAHKLAEQLRNEKPNGYVDILKKIVDRVCSDFKISGDASDYHNLSAELAQGSMYIEACKVLKKGLTFFQTDTNLLSDLVEYATKGSMFDDAYKSVQQLNNIERRLWTWRCYEFICDYYRAIGKLEEADKLCDTCILLLPDDEHAYRSKAEIARQIYPGMDGIEKSIQILNRAISLNINCPQCANALAETYLAFGQYEDALCAANRAILELAQEQPHVNISSVFYNRATIQDRMFMQKLGQHDPNQSLADAAYEDYRMALGFRELQPIVMLQAHRRMEILKHYVSTDLIEHDMGGSPNGFLEFLQTLKDNHDDPDET